MKVPDVETQAILALCHHQEGPFHKECEACIFRQAVAIEHLQRLVAGFMSA